MLNTRDRRQFNSLFRDGNPLPYARNFSSNGRVELPKSLRIIIGTELNAGRVTGKNLTDWYGIDKKYSYSMKKHIRDKMPICDGDGKPAMATDAVIDACALKLGGKRAYQPRVLETNKIILDTINEIRTVENHLPVAKADRNVMKKIKFGLKEKYDLGKKIANVGTQAREIKCASHLTALNWAAACNSVVPLLKHRAQSANSDACSYECSGKKEAIEVYALPKNYYEHGNIKTETDPECPDENDLNFTVKHYMTGFSAGFLTRNVIILADKRMPKDMIKIKEVYGLGSNVCDVTCVGYIVFAHDRSTPHNGAFYK